MAITVRTPTRSETFESWRWFLTMLAKHVVRMCLLSDRHGGLIKAVEYILEFRASRGRHSYCLRHVSSNFNTRFKSVHLKDLCWRAGAAYQIRKFDRTMEQIKGLNEAAYAYLAQIDKSKWTFAHDEGWRYGIMTTNLVECINGVLKGARRLPITAILRLTFSRSIIYFHDRLLDAKNARSRHQPWPNNVLKVYQSWQEESIHHVVKKFDRREQSAFVTTMRITSRGTHTHVVKIKNMECSCGKWSETGIPCSHVMHVCRHFRIDAARFVKDYYSTHAYVDIYSGKFELLMPANYWETPSFQLVHNPSLRERKRHGRDTITRIPNEVDWPQTRARQQYQSRQQVEPSQPRISSHCG